MTLEEKVGQLFFVRCPADSALSDVSKYHLGGYLLFGRDTKDKTADEIIQTIADYQAAAGEIPMVSRSRTVTQLSAGVVSSPMVAKSTVTQKGVPISSWRR